MVLRAVTVLSIQIYTSTNKSGLTQICVRETSKEFN